MTKKTVTRLFIAIMAIIVIAAVLVRLNPEWGYWGYVFLLAITFLGMFLAVSEGRHFQD